MSATRLHSASLMLDQLMLPLQSVVDFFSPPVTKQAIAGSHVASPALASHQFTNTAFVSTAFAQAIPAQRHPMRYPSIGHTTNSRASSADQVLRSRRAQDGRIVISGRMRDVCAELDRLCSDTA